MAKQRDERLTRLYKVCERYLNVVKKDLDKHTSHKSNVLNRGNKDGKVTIRIPLHIQFAAYGRGPGKKPPFDFILQWVKKERVKFSNNTDEGTAFAIQASIGLHGTKNWVPNAPDVVEESMKKNYPLFSTEFDKVLSTSIDEYLNERFNTIVVSLKDTKKK